jgi:hypothetical protein
MDDSAGLSGMAGTGPSHDDNRFRFSNSDIAFYDAHHDVRGSELMIRLLQVGWEWLFRAADVWTFIAWLSPALAGTVLGWLTYISGQPLQLILFVGLVSAACSLIIVSEIRKAVRENSVFQRLNFAGSIPIPLRPNYATGMTAIFFKCALENESDTKTIYFKLKRAHSALNGRVNPDPQLNETVSALPPKRTVSVQLAAIDGLPFNATLTGKMEIEVLYGPKEGDLKYMFVYETTPTIDFNWGDEREMNLNYGAPIKRYEHVRVR